MARTPEEKRAAEKAWRQKNREKCREYVRKYRAANLEKDKARQRRYVAEHPEKQKEWEQRNKDKRKIIKERYLSNPENALKAQQACANWRQSDEGKNYMRKWHRVRLSIPEKLMKFRLVAARWRATKANLLFDNKLFEIYLTNIPTHCKCCGTEFDYEMKEHRRRNRSPSIDRFDNSGGYTVDNTVVICTRCNTLKSDATVAELKLIVAYMENGIVIT